MTEFSTGRNRRPQGPEGTTPRQNCSRRPPGQRMESLRKGSCPSLGDAVKSSRQGKNQPQYLDNVTVRKPMLCGGRDTLSPSCASSGILRDCYRCFGGSCRFWEARVPKFFLFQPFPAFQVDPLLTFRPQLKRSPKGSLEAQKNPLKPGTFRMVPSQLQEIHASRNLLSQKIHAYKRQSN